MEAFSSRRLIILLSTCRKGNIRNKKRRKIDKVKKRYPIRQISTGLAFLNQMIKAYGLLTVLPIGISVIAIKVFSLPPSSFIIIFISTAIGMAFDSSEFQLSIQSFPSK